MGAQYLELRKRISATFNNSDSMIYLKTHWNHIDGRPDTFVPTNHEHQGKDISDANPVYFVNGNTSGTSGLWTGSIPNVSELYEGLTIMYKIGIDGSGSSPNYTTLNINGWGAVRVFRYQETALTTHFGVRYIVMLTYTSNSLGPCWMVNSDYDSTDPYTDRYNQYHQVGATMYDYKIMMEGIDGKIYPLTLQNGTGTTKTVSTQEMRVGGELMIYISTTDIAENATTRYYMASRWVGGVLHYTANQASGWVAYRPIYVVGTINANGNFILDNSSYTSWLTQTLPTSDDGKIYIRIGDMLDTTVTISFHEKQPWYQFKDGKLRLYIAPHTHVKADITDFPTSMPASDVYSWAKAATKPSYLFSEIGSKPSFTINRILVGSGGDTPSTLALGASGQVLRGTGGYPSWGTVAASEISGLGASYRWLTDELISAWNAKLSTVPNNHVDNAKLADMAASTVKGRATQSTGDPEDITMAQLKTLLALVKADVGLGNVDNTSDASKYVAGVKQTRDSANTKIWHGTQAQYDAIGTKDSSTLYFITA